MNEQIPKRRALGRGLEELFNIDEVSYSGFEENIMKNAKKEEIKEVPLDELRANPYQPRKNFDLESLSELANSIKEHGVFQPIIVKKSIKGYEIVAGERRVRASRMAGKETIPAIVKDFTDDQMLEIAILENLQREDLNAIEEAEAYQSLMKNLGITHEGVSKIVGKSRSHIANILGLLTLPENIKDLVIQGKISMGHARVLSKLLDVDKINLLANEIIERQLSVREIEIMASGKEYVRKKPIAKKERSIEYLDLERNLCDYLGTKIKLKNKKLEIFYENEEDLNRLLDVIGFEKKN